VQSVQGVQGVQGVQSVQSVQSAQGAENSDRRRPPPPQPVFCFGACKDGMMAAVRSSCNVTGAAGIMESPGRRRKVTSRYSPWGAARVDKVPSAMVGTDRGILGPCACHSCPLCVDHDNRPNATWA